MAVSLAACGAGEGGSSVLPKAASNKNDNVEIEGIYVDTSYVDDDNTSLKKVYVFLNLTATDTNLKYDCAYTKMTINDANSYDSDFDKGCCEYAPSYYSTAFSIYE